MPNKMQLKNQQSSDAIEIIANLPGVSITFQMNQSVGLALLVFLIGSIAVVTTNFDAVVALLISLVANYITYRIQKM